MTFKQSYLLLYNTLSLISWAYILSLPLTHLFTSSISPSTLQSDLHPLTIIQTLSLLEVLHALLGLVRSSPSTTALQIGGRNLVVWTVMRAFPSLVFHGNGRIAFLGCMLAWGASDALRFAYFVAAQNNKMWGWLKWLRYSAFVLLYPVGFMSEAWLVYVSFTQAEGISLPYRVYLGAGLLSYVPAFYVLYGYMFAQRRRALRK
ncbi:PTPLA-domain-containing protein [Xylariaceae sp. FL1272]|nr:PTPLA-domain-containing protein [Xylariaceae sp. FL1272]